MRHVALKDFKMYFVSSFISNSSVSEHIHVKSEYFLNKTATTIFLVQECAKATALNGDLDITVQHDDFKPAVYKAPSTVCLNEKLQRVEILMENLK